MNNLIKAINIYELNAIANGLVFDRMQSDVDHAIDCMKNCIVSGQDLKGAYNLSDKNRVAAAAKYINECMRSIGRHEASVKIKDNWNVFDIVKETDNEEVVTALKYLKSLLPEAPTAEVPGDLENLSYIKANTVERVLYDLCGMFARYLDAWFYCGEAFASDFDPYNWQGWDG